MLLLSPARAVGVLALLTASPLAAQTPASTPAPPIHAVASTTPTLPRALPNDHRRIAGTRRGRVVTVTLEPRLVTWTPTADPEAVYRNLAFAEPGQPARIPGPLLRARVGDTLRVTVRNPLDRALHVAGLSDRGAATVVDTIAGMPVDTLHVPAGEARTVTIPLTRAGSFWYDAVTTHPADGPGRKTPYPMKKRNADATLVGAFIVDEADAPRDAHRRERILLIHGGVDIETAGPILRRRGSVPDNDHYINGLAWPMTERFAFTVGDTVRWRILSTAFPTHPMHLHGFHFRVDARGSASRDTLYAEGDRRWGVTESMRGFSTARLTWVPERAGNWLFHCHLVPHVSATRLPAGQVPTDPRPRSAAAHDHGAHGAHDAGAAAADGAMAGLVLGITVREKPGRRTPDVEPTIRLAREPLHLFVTERDSVHGARPGYGYVLQRDSVAPASDSVLRPGTPIVVEQGRPVAILVHNTRSVPASVHWHGMELESRYDGVGGWSGRPGAVTPPILPGRAFLVRFTPPRAGTFIYHAHDEERRELAGGHYGALLVLPAGATRDTTRDHLLLFGAGVLPAAPGRPPVPFVNGDTGTSPLVLATGTAHRLRLVNITENDLKIVRLVDAEGRPLAWRVVGKDGWTPPAHQSERVTSAELEVAVGETWDVEVSAADAARARTLHVDTRYGPSWRRVLVHEAFVPVRSVP